jgi:hypothetical protein
VVIDAVNRMSAPEFDSRALIAAAAPSARYVRVQLAGLGELRRSGTRREPVLRRGSRGAGAGRGTHQRGRLEPAFVGDATATETVDALLPLWFALVRQNGGNRKVALRIAR